MLKLIAVFVPLLVVGIWAAPHSNNGNSTSDFNKIHIVIELRKNPLNTSAPEEVIVYQEVEDSREVTTPMAVTTLAAKPIRPATTSTPASSTPMSSLLAFDSSEEVGVRRPFPTFSPVQFPRYRPTISVPPKGPKLLLMGNRPTVDFLKRHFPKAQVATPITPSHNVVVRNARRTTNSAMAESAAKRPTFEVVGTYKDGTLHR
uniref:(northern house mosquito) hypothetical protein n=1 Tax=Culex pipiens TaxID=7175 RepID=A0A8D8K840_CULPI